MTDIVERLRTTSTARTYDSVGRAYDYPEHLPKEAADEIDRLRALVLDACKVFDHYDLPEQAFHYRRDILGLEQAKKIAAGGST